MNQPPNWTPLQPPAGFGTPMPYYGAQPPPPPVSKPSGLYKALGIVMICLGIAGAFWALFSIASLLLMAAYTKSAALYTSDTVIFGCVRAAMSFVTGTMLAIAGFGIVRAKKWSRLLALAYAALSLFDTFAGTTVNLLVIQPHTLKALGGSPMHSQFELITYVSAAATVLITSALPIVVIVVMLRAQTKQELDA